MILDKKLQGTSFFGDDLIFLSRVVAECIVDVERHIHNNCAALPTHIPIHTHASLPHNALLTMPLARRCKRAVGTSSAYGRRHSSASGSVTR